MSLTDRERAYFGPRTEKVPGSVAWCWQTISLMQARWEQKCLDEEGFDALVRELSTHEAWKVVPPEQPYGTLDALLKAEIGRTLPEARAEVRLQGQATGSGPQGGRPTKQETTNLVVLTQEDRARQNGIGRESQRKLDYLAGHTEDLYHAVQSGTLSIHAAYQRAKGYVPETPLEALRRAWCQASPAEQRQFLAEVHPPPLRERDYCIVYVRPSKKGSADVDPCAIQPCPQTAHYYFWTHDQRPTGRVWVRRHSLCPAHAQAWCTAHQVDCRAIPSISSAAWVSACTTGNYDHVPWFRFAQAHEDAAALQSAP